jgi:hypothetical protein
MGRNQSAVEHTVAALRRGGRLEGVDAATVALARHLAVALDRVDARAYPAQTASLARAQLAALRLLRGERDDDRDVSAGIDEILAAMSGTLGDAPES